MAGAVLAYAFFHPIRERYRAGTRKILPFAIGRYEIYLAVASLVVSLLIFFPYLRGGRPAADRKLFEGRGSIIHINELQTKITLRHGVIECLMPAVTMEYDLAIPALAEGHRPGERVPFLVAPRGADFAVVRIWPDAPRKSEQRKPG